MRYRFLIIALAAGLLLTSCCAQPTSQFQSVSGDFARSWLTSFQEQNPKPADNKSGDLWSWGGAPRGSKIEGGKLVANPFYNMTLANGHTNWLGDTYMDPYTGNPIYSYVDQNTGKTVYYYIDPKTGQPVFVDVNPLTGEPIASPSLYSASNVAPSVGSNGVNSVLPPVFSTNDPWA